MKNKWRKISEDGLPEDGVTVLAYAMDPCHAPCMFTAVWHKEGFWEDYNFFAQSDERGRNDAITHWMPLPEPPTSRSCTTRRYSFQ